MKINGTGLRNTGIILLFFFDAAIIFLGVDGCYNNLTVQQVISKISEVSKTI